MIQFISEGVASKLVEVYRTGYELDQHSPEWEASAQTFSDMLHELPVEIMAATLVEMTGLVVSLQDDLKEASEMSTRKLKLKLGPEAF